jgi:hypothetical protein
MKLTVAAVARLNWEDGCARKLQSKALQDDCSKHRLTMRSIARLAEELK